MTADYYRGAGDAKLFAEVEHNGDGWVGRCRGGGLRWIIQPVNDAYLRGLADGGCIVRDATPVTG